MTNRSRREFVKAVLASGVALGGMGRMAARVFAEAVMGAEAPNQSLNQVVSSVERRQLGRTDMKVSALGFGGAEIGSRRTDQASVEKLLNSALDAGLNVIDTAASYWGSEEAIGKAVAHRRQEYFLFTKAGHMINDEISWYQGWSDAEITKSIERSLRRLKTDRLDLVHLHSCDLDTLERGEAIEALEKAKKAGKTRYIGYSGDNAPARWAVESGRFDTLMTSLSIADQQAIELTLPIAREKQMGVIAKRPIANAAWIYHSVEDAQYPDRVTYWQRLQKLDYEFLRGEAKKKQGAGGPADIALRFTLSQPGVHTAIVGTSNPDRYRQNAELLKAGLLPKELVDSIRARWKTAAGKDWTGVE